MRGLPYLLACFASKAGLSDEEAERWLARSAAMGGPSEIKEWLAGRRRPRAGQFRAGLESVGEGRAFRRFTPPSWRNPRTVLSARTSRTYRLAWK
jgi:hypothetical protein